MNGRPNVAIVGIGAAPPSGDPSWSSADYAVEASRLALADAGAELRQVDGLVTCMDLAGGGDDLTVGRLLGFNPSYAASLDYGTCNFSVHLAAMVVEAGLADTVLLSYGTNQGTKSPGGFAAMGGADPWGVIDVVATIQALAFQRYRERYGMTEEQLGAVAVSQRAWARLNPIARRTDPLTVEDYLAAPYVIEPARSLDVCPFDDGGAALVLTRADRAESWERPPVHILGMAEEARTRHRENRDNIDRRWLADIADRAFAQAGVSRREVDFVSAQDPGSMWTVHILEAFGFAPEGGAGEMFLAGATQPGGELPVNTGGGHLSEGYLWGWWHAVEIIRQLRGDCGERQVPDASLAVHGSTMLDFKGAATIFGRER